MSFILTLIITASLIALSELMRPDSTVEGKRPAGRGDFNFPTASEDRFNPIVWGTVMLEGPNVTWWGALRPKSIHIRVKSALFISKKTKIGYGYYVGIQMGLCRGPIDAITRVLVGEKEIFSGDQGEGTVYINQPDLFGGDEEGGGIVGQLDILVGTTSQAPNSYLAQYQTITSAPTPNAPRYGGSAYVVANDMYVGTSTQIQAWKFEVRRIPNGLGLAGGEATVNGYDANPANVLYEILTDTEWGLGYPTAAINTSNFASAGSILAAENNGWSFTLDSGKEAPELIAELERQIDGLLRVNRTTGLFEIKLARQDYDIDTVPQITDADVRSVEKFTRGEWAETTNELRGVFTHRESDYKSVPAFAQDAANIAIQGRVVSAKVMLPGVKDPDLASDITWRMLRTLCYPLAAARLKVNRKFYATNRGDVIAWTNGERGITKLGMRVLEVDYGTIKDGTIELEIVEDVFRSDAASFGSSDPTKWVHPEFDLGAFDADKQIAFEAPRKFLTLDEGGISDRIWCGARQKDVASSFLIVERHAAGTPSGDFSEAGETFGFLLIGKLLGALAAGSAIPLSTLVLDPDPDIQTALQSVFVPDTVENLGYYLGNLLLVGDEFMIASSAEDVGGNVQLNDVYRAVCDTVQAAHSAGDLVWLLFVAGNLTETIFPPGDNVHIKLLPRARNNQLAEGDATQIDLALADRLRCPYPPSRIILNSVAYPATVSLEGVGADGDDYGVGIDWTRRDLRTVDEIDALTIDAATLFADFPTEHDTKYTVTVREDPSGSNLLVGTFTEIQPTQIVLRNEILKVTDGVLPSELRFIIQTTHTYEATNYVSLQDLVYDPAVSTALTGDFNFGALNGYEVSNLYTATDAGTYNFALENALPSSTTTVEYRLNSGAWTTLIAATMTTGSIVGVVATDTIEIRHTEVSADLRRFISMTAPGAGQDGYALLFTGAFAPDSLEELTAWWNFSDKGDLNLSGTTILGAFDKSGNGNDLVQSGLNRPSLTTVAGMFMGQFTESPSGEWMFVTDDTALNFGSDDFTILIVYKTADNDRASLIDKGVSLKYFVRINDVDVGPTGKFRFDINDGTTYSVIDNAIDYSDDAVRLVTMRRDGNDLRSYADGVETGASPTNITGVGTIDGATSLFVGARQGTGQYLDGQIGEIIMYKGTITDPELALVHDWLKTKWGIS